VTLSRSQKAALREASRQWARQLLYVEYYVRVQFAYHFGRVPRGNGRQVALWLKLVEVAHRA
jgi:hypothetical protein